MVTVTDTLKPAIVPKNTPLLDENTTNLYHEIMVHGGIYKPDAFTQYEDIIQYGSIHEDIIHDFTIRICRNHDGPCEKDKKTVQVGGVLSRYDPRRLYTYTVIEGSIMGEINK